MAVEMTNPSPPTEEPSPTKSRPLSDYIPIGTLNLRFEDWDTNNPDRDWSPSHFPKHYPWRLLEPAWPLYAADHKPLIDAIAGLRAAGWVRVFGGRSNTARREETWRIYLLADDVARASIDGRSKKYEKLLQLILKELDTSSASWQRQANSETRKCGFDPWATAEHSSLFYLFNTLSSPSPDPEVIPNEQLRHSVYRLLEEDSPPWGLKTSLYPYQRRCVAKMVQKENAQGLQLDPRLEPRQSPNGERYYFGARDQVFFKTPRYYETCQGGILAETMGLGKTLICIATILLTRGQLPAVPVPYGLLSEHPTARSLADTAAAKLLATGLPWKTFFEDYEHATQDSVDACKAVLNRQRLQYEVPPTVIRSMRHASKYGPAEHIHLCSTTIVVVPQNLLHQWQSELVKHVKEDALKVLVLKDRKVLMPPASELREYDVVLFSKNRFEAENRSNVEVEYRSPLKDLHWLRIIIDEGHGFSSTTTNAAVVAEKLVKAERRWVVSGTPARDLLGVEVDVAAMTSCETEEDFEKYKVQSLASRQAFDETQERSSGAIKSIGALATKFLKAKPWSLKESEGGATAWDEYIYRHEDFRARTYSGFSQCLRTTLQDLMIKTRPEDVDKDVKLPPFKHQIIRLEPSMFDKMTANLFVLLYTTNAVTSERRDQDYLFHPSSRAHLQRLTTNLRQSSFYWVGFNQLDVAKSVETGEKYLSKNETLCSPDDRILLRSTMAAAKQILNSLMWRALSFSTDMGIFAEDWPEDSTAAWAFDRCSEPPMIGLTQAIEAQRFVNSQLALDDPLAEFNEEGRASKRRRLDEEAALENRTLIKSPDDVGLSTGKVGIPSSGYGNGSMGSKRVSGKGASRVTPKKPVARYITAAAPDEQSDASAKKRKVSASNSTIDLDSDHQLGRTRIIGTASAKLSYLIDRVAQLQKDEKILIFYDANYIAYYISQALDLLDIKHLIYANTLTSEKRSKYCVLFDTDPSYRVLVMDLKQAAHGLDFSSPSRVFFVNPPWRPDVEAQAIKRAHRIGQTRPVHVETLILKGTVEEAMYERAAKMTKREHLAAKILEEDADMRNIIQDQKVIPISEDETIGINKIAPLQVPQQLFGRPSRAGKRKAGKMEKEVFGEHGEQADAGLGEDETASPVKKKRKKNKAKVSFQDDAPATDSQGQAVAGNSAASSSSSTGGLNPATSSSIFGNGS